jgi:uncharacterized protein YkwD
VPCVSPSRLCVPSGTVIFCLVGLVLGGCSARPPVETGDAADIPAVSDETESGGRSRANAPENSLPPAKTYGPQADEPLNASESELWQQIVNVIGSRCQLDGALVRAARKHASDVTGQPGMASNASGIDYLRFALRYFGCPDYLVSPVVFDLNHREGTQALLRTLGSRRAGEWTHCGIGVANGGESVTAVFVAVTRLVSLSAFSSRVTPGHLLSIHGTLDAPDATGVEAFVEAPDGQVTQVKTYLVGKRQFKVSVPIGEAGKYKLEFQVSTRSGPETAVLLPLFAGVEVPRRPSIFPDARDSEANPLQQMTRLINRVRENHGLQPLVRDLRLDAVAQRHCEDMANSATFGHYSTHSGKLEDRLQAMGLFPRATAENIAQSNSVVRVHHNLMQSPSHRIKVLTSEFTHLGLGIVSRDGITTVTQIFAAW